VLSYDCAEETDDEIANSKRYAERLSDGGPGAHSHTEQDQLQDDVRQVMAEGVVMFVVAAGDVEERQNAENHVQNTRDNQNCFPPLAPHSLRYARPDPRKLD
jgi:hypothetical protein